VDLAHYNNTINGESRINGTTYNSSASDTYVFPNLKIGKVNTEERKYVSYTTTYLDDQAEYNLFYESLDFNYDKFGETINGLKPYYGAHIGLGFLTFEAAGNSTTKSSIEYGMQAGLLKEIDKSSNFELGVKYKLGTAKIQYTSGSDYAKLEADSVIAFFVGYNKKF
jgi:hypothetical protein